MSERNRDYLPRVFLDLRAEHPGVAEAYDGLGDACRHAGPALPAPAARDGTTRRVASAA